MVLSDDQGLANLSFAGSTARNTSECGMASGKTALDRRVRNTVGRGSGRSRPRSSVADDMQAQGGQGGGEIQNAEAARLQNGLEEFVAAEGEPFGSSYASIPWGRLEPGTRLGYVAALRQFLRYSRVHGWLSPREALEGLQGMGTSKGRSRRSYVDSGWRRKQGSFSPWYEDRMWFSQSPCRSCEQKRTTGGYSGHRQESCMRWQPARERSHGRKWNVMHWQHYRYATCYASERHGRPTGAGWANWYSAEKRAAQASKCRTWGRGPTGGCASSTRSDAGGGGMVKWHTTSHPRANWKPSGSSWSLGRAIGPCAGMGTNFEAQHRHGQLGLEVPSCSSWEGGVHH